MGSKTAERQRQREILKVVKEKWLFTYQGIPIRLTTDFSSETTEVRMWWDDILKMPKEKYYQPRIICPTKLCNKPKAK